VHRTVGVVVVTLALLASCKKKREDQVVSAPPAAEEAVRSVDEMIKRTFAKYGREYVISDLDIQYVRPDGTLDPSYGKVDIETTVRLEPDPPPPADDPNRPVGAPEPDRGRRRDPYLARAMAKCPDIQWTSAGMRVTPEASCSIMPREVLQPRCTVVGILALARDGGAPPNALGRIQFGQDVIDNGQTWTFTVDDNPRDIHFRLEGKDDCAPIMEKP
jgi:hypothetical protein